MPPYPALPSSPRTNLPCGRWWVSGSGRVWQII